MAPPSTLCLCAMWSTSLLEGGGGKILWYFWDAETACGSTYSFCCIKISWHKAFPLNRVPVLLLLLWGGNCWKEQNCVPAPAVNLRRCWPLPGEQCKLWCINTHWRLLRVNVIEPLGWQLKAARVCCVNTCTGTVTGPPSALSACKQRA